MTEASPATGIVVIGRNEGERLKACLAALPEKSPIVYVDSGSSDGSADWVVAHVTPCLHLTSPPAFSAARARNAGFAWLRNEWPDLKFVQMIDGDCVIASDWLPIATQALLRDTGLAAVCGALRERHPESSLYNRMCDLEWSGPTGPILACGGIALFRLAALEQVGGYAADLIAGEEPDMCLRMRQLGWRIERLPHAMASHDANITNAFQWLTRARRSGHAFAELNMRHGANGDPKWRRQLFSILMWTVLLPMLVLMGMAGALTGHPVAALISVIGLLLYPIQVWRMSQPYRRQGFGRHSMSAALLMLAAKFWQGMGAMRFYANLLGKQKSALIEYRTPVT
jgi:GT2 family glycosyltransferase